jgi:multisite-specific tRNA:(cytosine-C5)-methyltransferase
MLPKEDRKAMLLRLYNDESPLQDHHQRQRQQKQQEDLEKAHNSSSDREVVAAGGHGGIGDIDDMLDAAMDAEAKPATIEDDEDGTAAVSPPPVKDRLALADEDEEILVADGGAAVEETVPGNAELEVEAEKDQDEKME